jgi:S-adenosylmethionine:tRNA ribosyltransferase-isomerase
LEATVLEKNPEGHCRLLFSANENVLDKLDKLGQAPLPPYIARLPNAGGVNDTERYQTVYAEIPGSVAAPTAGLHFTQSLLAQIRAAGVHVCFITLHVGLGTFAPVKTSSLAAHPMHAEHFAVKDDAASMVNDAKRAGGRIVAVGTTTVRVLEAVAQQNQGKMAPASGRTNLFIYPPFQFQVVDVLLTNFHLPKSTLLMLVCAFASPNTTRGRDTVMAAYGEAIRQQYRFYSYGDAMLID